MKNLKQIFTYSLITLALSISTYAGESDSGTIVGGDSIITSIVGAFAALLGV